MPLFMKEIAKAHVIPMSPQSLSFKSIHFFLYPKSGGQEKTGNCECES